jgi:hypothetical protein
MLETLKHAKIVIPLDAQVANLVSSGTDKFSKPVRYLKQILRR